MEGANNMSKPNPMIAVVGSNRSGTSCVSGMLHKLGVSMGRRFLPPDKHNETGYYEAAALRAFCYRSTKDSQRFSSEKKVQWLREWAQCRNETAIVGCKHPLLCLLLPEMKQVWPDLKVITTERPVTEIKASLMRAGWWNSSRQQPEHLIVKRDADLSEQNIPTLRLDYHDVLRNPEKVVDSVIQFVGITPTPEQRQSAIDHVNPSLCHISSSGSRICAVAPDGSYDGPVDIVYPLSNKSVWKNNELRYSLRSLEKFAVNLGRVFVVGSKPEWLTNVVHIPMTDSFRRNKDANIIKKVRAAIAAGCTERFIFASDDQFLLTHADFQTLPATYGKTHRIGSRRGRWWARMDRTFEYLSSRNRKNVFYDTHLFQPHSASEFERIVSGTPYWRGIGFCINTLVMNLYDSVHPFPDSSVRGVLMRGYDNDTLNRTNLKEMFASNFPNKSRYEL